MSDLKKYLSDGWTTDQLDNLVDVRVSNVDKKSLDHEPLVRLCNYMDVYSNDYITSNIDFMNATADKSQISKFVIKKGDVMITKDSETPDDIGIAAVSLEDFEDVVCGYHLALFKPYKDKICGEFLAKQLGQYEVNRQFANKANGSTRYGLTLNVIKTAVIPFPVSVDKQRKIAHILTTCDSVIEQTQSAMAKYIAIKQGLLHDLFTRGLDANGHLRPSHHDTPELYKESELGMIPKEWEVKRLEEITTKIGDGIHTTPTYVESSDYKFINGNNLVDGIINITNKTNSVSFEEYTKHKIDLNEKTVLMSINGTIGNLAYYRNEKVILGKSAAYICCGNDVDVEYIYSFLGTTILLKYFTDELTGSTIQNLSLASIRNAPILFPKPVEQKMIVKILDTFTNKIQTEETLLQKYQSIKRGLMGDLLGGGKTVGNDG